MDTGEIIRTLQETALMELSTFHMVNFLSLRDKITPNSIQRVFRYHIFHFKRNF